MNRYGKGESSMFNRVELKENAKQALKHFYAIALLACFLYSLLSGDFFDMWGNFRGTLESIFRGDFFVYFNRFRELAENSPYLYWGNAYYYRHGGVLLAFIIGSILFWIRTVIKYAYRFFVVAIADVGMNSFFLKNRHQDTKINELLTPFQTNYMNQVKVLFIQNLYIFLWSLLFVIPGIIKSYEYYFVSYLLAEQSDLTIEQALSLSRKMTDGEKWNIFVFELSFIGWFLLGSLLGGIGWILVLPYYRAAKTELYVCLKERKLL